MNYKSALVVIPLLSLLATHTSLILYGIRATGWGEQLSSISTLPDPKSFPYTWHFNIAWSLILLDYVVIAMAGTGWLTLLCSKRVTFVDPRFLAGIAIIACSITLYALDPLGVYSWFAD